MKHQPSRRSFLKKSVAATLAAPLITSLEEYALAARDPGASPAPPATPPKSTLATGQIGKVKVGRLICGGNLISGYAHSRDLIYVSPLLTHYFTDEKIMDTWALCEEHGINTMIAYAGDPHAVAVYQKYRNRGGRIQHLAQIAPSKDDLKTSVQQAVDSGAVGAFLVGNNGDAWTRENAVGRIGELVKLIQDCGLIAGVAGHELRTPQAVEKEGIAPDFYVKTLHSTNYWSKRRPDEVKDVIDNYGIDNYWCKDPTETIRYMATVERPWIAYKVLAAGAIHPRAGFKHAFDNGADFVAVGMFDFQIGEDATIANAAVKAAQNRDRDWYA